MDKKKKMEEYSFGIILHAGNSYSLAYEAIARARAGELVESRKLMKKAEEEKKEAHQIQTEMLSVCSGENDVTPDVLLVHAQCHISNSVVISEMAKELIAIYERLIRIEKKGINSGGEKWQRTEKEEF